VAVAGRRCTAQHTAGADRYGTDHTDADSDNSTACHAHDPLFVCYAGDARVYISKAEVALPHARSKRELLQRAAEIDRYRSAGPALDGKEQVTCRGPVGKAAAAGGSSEAGSPALADVTAADAAGRSLEAATGVANDKAIPSSKQPGVLLACRHICFLCFLVTACSAVCMPWSPCQHTVS